MCYSATSSFGTFLFVFCISLFLWIKGSKIQKTLAIILVFIALMQVIEGLLWLNIECNDINIYITSFIPILLFLQPIVLLLSIYYFKTGILPPILYIILLYIWLVSIPLFMNWIKDGQGKCTTIGENKHLVWPFINTNEYFASQIIYNTLLSIGFISLNTPWYGLFYFIFSAISFFKSRNTYGHSWSSVWCHFVNILALGALFI